MGGHNMEERSSGEVLQSGDGDLNDFIEETSENGFSDDNYDGFSTQNMSLEGSQNAAPNPQNGSEDYFESVKSKLSLPLADMIRPTGFHDYVGQKHLVNDENGSIKNFIRLGYLPSMVLYGPPGVGKTTIASILSKETGYVFFELSATDSTIADLREVHDAIKGENAKRLKYVDGNQDPLRIVLFIDEIHRFSSTQQDFLLPFVESGLFVFIGATTVNPETRIRRAILSRCQMFKLAPLLASEVRQVMKRAILFENIRRRMSHNMRFLAYSDACLDIIIKKCAGDTRSAINLIELTSSLYNDASALYTAEHEENFSPIELDETSLEDAISRIRKIQLGLHDPKNMALFLNLFDAMNHVDSRRKVSLGANEENTAKFPSSPVIPDKEENVPENTAAFDSCKKLKAEILDTASDISMTASLPDTAREKEWAERMEYSDDSDVEPVAIYSDEEADVPLYNMNKVPRSKYYVLVAVHTLLLLLKRGESPFFVMKQLMLFASMNVEADTHELRKLVGLLRALKQSNADPLKVLSNCVQRLTSLPKSHTNIARELKSMKKYCSETLSSTDDPFATQNFEDVEVVFDRAVVELLLERLAEKTVEDPIPPEEAISVEKLDERMESVYSLGFEAF